MQYCKTSPDKVRSQTPSAEYDSSLVSEKNLLAIPFFLKPSRINYSLILLEFGLAQPQLVYQMKVTFIVILTIQAPKVFRPLWLFFLLCEYFPVEAWI